MNKPYIVSVITTVRHNIGDDFVREGILHLLDSSLKDVVMNRPIKVELIHKHSPVTSQYGFEKIRSLRASRIVEPLTRGAGLPDRVSKADLLIQSGAPIYWCHPEGSHCADNEWYLPLIQNRFLKDRRGRKFLNLAGGSCQRYHSDGSELKKCSKCSEYISQLFDVSDLTVLRDHLAKKMLNSLGREADVLPCTSIFARDQLGIEPGKGEYIVLNFMENGGHFKFNQKIDSEKWRNNFRKIVRIAGKMGRLVMACHNQAEYDLACEVVPDVEVFLVPDDHFEFMKFYANARFAVVNRVHAAFMMASFGKPSAVIGTDSRALMVNNLNLPSYFVEDLGDVELMVEDVANREQSYLEEVTSIRNRARQSYLELIQSAL